jgi:Rv2525c-like, glycoside hydrolase-like domain
MGRIRNITVITATTGTLMLGLTGVTLASVGGSHAGHTAAGDVRAATAAADTSATQLVKYLGYQVTVPASWPVYRLAADPSRCVLFNKHAVYLGNPGPDQRCPSSALGKTEALLVQPLTSQANLPPATSVQPGKTAELPSGKKAAQDAVSQTLRLALPTAGVEVTASYGQDATLIRSILRSAHLNAVSPAAVRQAAQVAAGPATPGYAAASGSPERHAPAQRGSAHRGSGNRGPARHQTRRGSRRAGRNQQGRVRHAGASMTPSATASPTPSPLAATATSSFTWMTSVTGSGLGFDTCTVPSAATMKSWLASPFRMVGTYLGGDNWACNYGNFSKSWVGEVAAMGWRFIPLWVGPQAPCTSIGGAVRINSSQAYTEGKSQAASAVSTAVSFGYGKGSPIYFDMEGYNNTDRSCSSAVLNFLAGWTAGLHNADYRSGVYSSSSSGVTDLAGEWGHYNEPNDVWFAEWNRDAVVTSSSLRSSDWPGYRRLHQFDGPNVEQFGGVKVDIDDDFVAGDVAGLRAPSGAYVLGQPDISHLSPGASGRSKLVITATASQGDSQSVGWKIKESSGVTVRPDKGTVVVTPGQPATIGLRIKVSSSASAGRRNLTVSAGSDGKTLSGTTLLVTVARHTLITPKPVVMYAADHASMTEARLVARKMALPPSAATDNYETAWKDVASGKSIVLAVGQAALNALYHNPCGWSNPSHMKAGSTPFIALGGPLDQPPGKIYFENAAGTSLAQTSQITDALMKYAVTGTLPSPHAMPAAPAMANYKCLK